MLQLSTHGSLCRLIVVLPKFSSELMQRTGTDGTELKVRFSPVPVLQFWLWFGSRFSEFSKIPELFENRSKFMVKKDVKYLMCDVESQ